LDFRTNTTAEGEKADVAEGITEPEAKKLKSNTGNATAAPAGALTESEKLAKRQERFGTVLSPQADERKRKRAERFGVVNDADKKILRAARFGIVDPDEKKKARGQRFGITGPSNSAEKKAARAQRFAGLAAEPAGITQELRSKRTVGNTAVLGRLGLPLQGSAVVDPAEAEKREKRGARFATASS